MPGSRSGYLGGQRGTVPCKTRGAGDGGGFALPKFRKCDHKSLILIRECGKPNNFRRIYPRLPILRLGCRRCWFVVFDLSPRKSRAKYPPMLGSLVSADRTASSDLWRERKQIIARVFDTVRLEYNKLASVFLLSLNQTKTS